jgi:hypothetical protein
LGVEASVSLGVGFVLAPLEQARRKRRLRAGIFFSSWSSGFEFIQSGHHTP